jgi:hypothetical protein
MAGTLDGFESTVGRVAKTVLILNRRVSGQHARLATRRQASGALRGTAWARDPVLRAWADAAAHARCALDIWCPRQMWNAGHEDLGRQAGVPPVPRTDPGVGKSGGTPESPLGCMASTGDLRVVESSIGGEVIEPLLSAAQQCAELRGRSHSVLGRVRPQHERWKPIRDRRASILQPDDKSADHDSGIGHPAHCRPDREIVCRTLACRGERRKGAVRNDQRGIVQLVNQPTALAQ